MLIKIKNLSDAAVRDIHALGNYKPYEKYDKRNDLKLAYIFNCLATFKIDYAFNRNDKHFTILTRSIKEPGKIQATYGYYAKDGEMILCNDLQFSETGDMTGGDFPSGIYQLMEV
jgi:hypothetical protein